MGSLVTELGALPEKAKRRSSQHQRRKSKLINVATSPEQKDWKNGESIGGVVAKERQLQEGRLPVIVEGKHYPRKTLESLEISHLLESNEAASESPELGPPPVAHFDVAEPIEFEPTPMLVECATQTVDCYQDHEDDVKPLPETLERRRRRRASALLEDMSTPNVAVTEVSNAAEQNISLKSGAKRKLDGRGHGHHEEDDISGLDDFAYERKTIAAETPQVRCRGTRFRKSGTASVPSSVGTKDPAPKLEPGTRKVLAPKSTNSPSKYKMAGHSDKTVPAEDEPRKGTKDQEQLEHKEPKAPPADSSGHINPPEVKDLVIPQEPNGVAHPPKTPSDLGFLSPASTEPSTRAGPQKEIALTAAVEDVLGGADGRTSRRGRGTVSYVEPSLRAKMRRPTKELVAAVGEQTKGSNGQQQESNTRARSQERQVSHDASVIMMRTVAVKCEKSTDGFTEWKDLPEAKEEPTSPLVDKGCKSSRMESPSNAGLKAPKSRGSNANAQQLEAALESLRIFDGPESSPKDSPDTVEVACRKTSRRHSSNPDSLKRVDQEFGRPAARPDRPQARNTTTRLNDPPPRPISAASLRTDSLGREEKMGLKRSASVTTLKSLAGMKRAHGDVVPSAAVAGKTERAAARRSMIG